MQSGGIGRTLGRCGALLALAACGSTVNLPDETAAAGPGSAGTGATAGGDGSTGAGAASGTGGAGAGTTSTAAGGAAVGVGGGPSSVCLSDAGGKPLGLRPPSTAFALAPGVRFDGFHVDAVAIGDVTGDGRADIVGAGYEGIVVAAQTANGTVGAAQVLPAAVASGFALLRTGDDALYDVALGSYDSQGKLHRADGLGGFLAAEPFGAPFSSFFRTADLDGDGRVDVVADLYDQGTFVAYGTPTGLAAPQQLLEPLDFTPQLLAIRDLDGDQAPDLITRSLTPDMLRVVPNDGMGGVLVDAAWEVSLADDEFEGGYVGLGDPTGDGVVDLVRQHELGFASYDSRVRLAPGTLDATGLLSFGPWQEIGATGYTGPVTVVDLDGDGRDDVVGVHEAQFQLGFAIAHDGGMGPWQLQDMPTAATNTGAAVVGDIDCDGCPDVLALDGSIVYFRGLGCGG